MIRNIFKQRPYLLLLTAIIILHLFMKIGFGDDYYFIHALDNKNLFEFLKERYFGWSSRILPEAISIFVSNNPFLFIIIDILSWFFIVWSINYLIKATDYKDIMFTSSLFFLYPIFDMHGAGWVATSSNYMWTLAALLGACSTYYYLQTYPKKKITNILFWGCLIYASSQEQSCLFLVILASIAILFKLKEEKKPWLEMVSLFCSICCLSFILFAPGNAHRTEAEISLSNLTFPSLSLFDKGIIGCLRFMNVFICSNNLIFFIYTFILFVLGWNLFHLDRKYKLLICSIPFIISLGFLAIKQWVNYSYLIFPDAVDRITIKYNDFHIYILLFYFVIFVFCSLFAFFQNGERKGIVLTSVFFGGLLSQIAMGFSPTVYTSGYRTSIFMYFSLIFCTVYLFTQIKPSFVKKSIFFIIGLLSVIMYCQTLLMEIGAYMGFKNVSELMG